MTALLAGLRSKLIPGLDPCYQREREPAQPCTPILKWVGGKTKLLPELLARLPSSYGRYYEPFAGGAALFLRLAPARAVLNDANADLIELYHVVRDDVDNVIKVLEMFAKTHEVDGKNLYYSTREDWNERRRSWSAAERAAAFVYLNKTCFNGLWRVNSDGHFNVPMGKYKNPAILRPEALRAASAALARAELRSVDYREAVGDAVAGDLVYFDPPYVPASPTSNFTSYTEGGFGERHHRELADTARVLVARGVHVLLSNSDTPLTCSLYDGLRMDSVQCGRAINADASKRGAVGEIIVVGTPAVAGTTGTTGTTGTPAAAGTPATTATGAPRRQGA